MNKFTLDSFPVVDVLKTVCQRGLCLLRGEKHGDDRGPQWQQLELPFSRTPVRKWNR
ncbi:hypothetical protein JIN77_15305 [Verrucomicrobiaceae bacterium R5-34]|uniref:Uncharacterized protein n=1 Tax=Oceaniferula flava TaxID=2800421 RepID=A0AAE2VCZ8_9BACT|nr:hypothetical protein [Oceaniferula flavus]MBK1832103.1 hypothetical protein [Verrucomicrobiaceae bacterium R5-34]MBK1856215.1 hypothetical protein [Oceaniferula flavus]MBM1137522.1 hypothetical protein [Oceaniferula flavus]